MNGEKMYSTEQQADFASARAQKYHFSDFTRDNYQRLLMLAKENYQFRLFWNFNEAEKFVLWRHDVDFSMHAARRLARIEADQGVKATYYLLLHSEFYNLLEREVSDCVREIIQLGHDIALHFDVRFYDIHSKSQLEDRLRFEKMILEDIYEHPVRSF
jgi:hypothetical protein